MKSLREYMNLVEGAQIKTIAYLSDGFPHECRNEDDCIKAIKSGEIKPESRVTVYSKGEHPVEMTASDNPVLSPLFAKIHAEENPEEPAADPSKSTGISYEYEGFPYQVRSKAECVNAINKGELTPDSRITVHSNGARPVAMTARDNKFLMTLFPSSEPTEPTE